MYFNHHSEIQFLRHQLLHGMRLNSTSRRTNSAQFQIRCVPRPRVQRVTLCQQAPPLHTSIVATVKTCMYTPLTSTSAANEVAWSSATIETPSRPVVQRGGCMTLEVVPPPYTVLTSSVFLYSSAVNSGCTLPKNL